MKKESRRRKELKHCHDCGKKYTLRTVWQRYCSDRCRNRAGARAWRAKASRALALFEERI